MDREEAVLAALQLQHDTGLIISNLQVLGQFITSINQMSSEVMWLVFGQEQFPSVEVQAVLIVATRSSPGTLHGSHGFVASSGWPVACAVVLGMQ